MALRLKTKERLLQALKKFTLEDFFKYALREFQEVKEEEITDVLSKNHLNSSKREVLSVFLNLLSDHQLNNEDCEKRIVLLQIQAVALKPEKFEWTALHMKGDPDMYGYTEPDFEQRISRSLRRNGFESIVRVVHHKSAFWINITLKKIVRKRLVHSSPIFCVFYLPQPYIFINKLSSTSIETPVIEALGYVDYDKCKLTGRDLSSMLDILMTKNSRPDPTIVPQLDYEPMETADGLNYSQVHQRKKYITNLFSSDAPKLSNYSVECREAPWHPHSSFPQMADKTYYTRLRFKTNHTVEMFRALAEEDILELPVPPHISRLLQRGRNTVKVRKTNTAS